MAACERLKLSIQNQHWVQPNKSAPRTDPHQLPISPPNQKHMCPPPLYPCYHWSQKVGPPSENSIQVISVAQCCLERKPSIFSPYEHIFAWLFSWSGLLWSFVVCTDPSVHLGIWPFPEPITFSSLKAISEETIAFSRTTDVYMTMTETHAVSLIFFPVFYAFSNALLKPQVSHSF